MLKDLVQQHLVSEGYNTTAGGNYSHSEGNGSQAIGDGSHAEGYETRSIGYSSHSEGIGTIAYGEAQLAVGKYNTATNSTDLFVIGNGLDDLNRSDIVKVGTQSITLDAILLSFPSIPSYDDEAAATIAGLTSGNIYQTTGSASNPLNVPGILMIKQ